MAKSAAQSLYTWYTHAVISLSWMRRLVPRIPYIISASTPSASRSSSRIFGSSGPGLGPSVMAGVKPQVIQLIDTSQPSLLILAEPRPHAVPHPHVFTLDEPVEPIFQLFYAGDQQLPLGRGPDLPIGQAGTTSCRYGCPKIQPCNPSIPLKLVQCGVKNMRRTVF